MCIGERAFYNLMLMQQWGILVFVDDVALGQLGDR